MKGRGMKLNLDAASVERPDIPQKSAKLAVSKMFQIETRRLDFCLVLTRVVMLVADHKKKGDFVSGNSLAENCVRSSLWKEEFSLP